MDCRITLASEADLETLIRLRMDFVRDIHPEFDAETIALITRGADRYIREHAAKKMYAGFLGFVGDEIVCSAGLLTYVLPPLYSDAGRKIAHVLNFYTKKEYRKSGYGFTLMEYMKSYAKDNGFYKLDLSATEDGYGLYKKCGYTDSPRAMEYKLM